jgi:tryptophan halogenase
MIDKICIVGGGTSGYIAALMLRSAYPNLDIQLIESSKIGIVGVGEGTTEHFRKFIIHSNINIFDLFRETDATFKIGIKFQNWLGNNKHYWHNLTEFFVTQSDTNGLFTSWLQLVMDNVEPDKTVWDLAINGKHIAPLDKIISQFHFNTFKLNSFFRNLSITRNIHIVDTEIVDTILDENNNINHIIDKDNKIYAADFFIDCTGFARILARKLEVKWHTIFDKLPMNSALAFSTDITEVIPNYTLSTAMSSGWAWRIPTQERYGNGYVFCNNFINPDRALDEIENYYVTNNITKKITDARYFNFTSGFSDKFWYKNCAFVGLSGLFVEPLEATSIGAVIQQCFLLTNSLYFFHKNDTKVSKIHNDRMNKIVSNIIDFIQLHYLTSRKDSNFWKFCKNDLKLTDFNAEYLDYMSYNFPDSQLFQDTMLMFNCLNFGQVMLGLNLISKKGQENIKQQFQKHLYINSLKLEDIYNDMSNPDLQTYSHNEAIELLKELDKHEYKYKL